jgi:CheY-like chemotaxis protein
VEDDADLLEMASQLLHSLGHQVHEARDGPTACVILDTGGRIDLLLTDAVLPNGLNGPDVAARAQKQYPNIKMLYISGYNEHPILSSGAGQPITLINKPSRKVQFANEVRDALGHDA